MDAKEFIKEKNRMCKYYNHICLDCAVRNASICSRKVADLDEEFVDTVEQWSKDHPRKTNFDKALEIIRKSFPLADVAVKNYWDANTSCFVISARSGFWGQEYKGDE